MENVAPERTPVLQKLELELLCLKGRVWIEVRVFWFVLVRVISWIVLSFSGQKERSTRITRTEHETRYHRNRLLWQSPQPDNSQPIPLIASSIRFDPYDLTSSICS